MAFNGSSWKDGNTAVLLNLALDELFFLDQPDDHPRFQLLHKGYDHNLRLSIETHGRAPSACPAGGIN
jgi:hypothetical protein